MVTFIGFLVFVGGFAALWLARRLESRDDLGSDFLRGILSNFGGLAFVIGGAWFFMALTFGTK